MNVQLEATNNYQQALKQGRKSHRDSVNHGKYPYLQVLDEVLSDSMVAGQVDLGLIEVPLDKIAGTKTAGRVNAFSSDFLPLLGEDSEFAYKWRQLCCAHLGDEGIHDPIRCFEYLGRFYVQEGNKRVSVMKYFGARSITGYVIRILPTYSQAEEVQCYYEFLHYYPLTGLYSLQFTRLGSFPKLQVALGFDLDHSWTEEERRRFSAAFFRFEREFVKHSDRAEGLNVADALLVWLKVYTFAQLRDMTAAELTKSMQAVWPDIAALKEEEVITVDTGAEKEESTSIVRRLFSILPSSTLNAAFIHELRPENSTWVQGHERGRLYLEDTLGEQVETQVYYGVGNGEEAEDAMEKAIENGAEVIFATTAPLIAACRKTAAKYPNVKILNCSISMPYTGVRTYYSRIYEGKFISGAIAGAVSKRDRIGYIASSPIFGVPAGINAFALGLQMTNPRARVSLKWSCLEGDPLAELRSEGVDTISTLDIPLPGWEHGRWGLFRIKGDGSTELLASPYWDWGEFYVKLCRSIMSGTWDNLSSKHANQAVNYWWGMSSGVIALQLEKSLPAGVETLANILIRDMTGGAIAPFHRPITSQDGTVRNDGNTYFTTAELLHMDWLCDNVDGAIPPYELLSEKARNIVELQGIYRDRIPPKKEGILL